MHIYQLDPLLKKAYMRVRYVGLFVAKPCYSYESSKRALFMHPIFPLTMCVISYFAAVHFPLPLSPSFSSRLLFSFFGLLDYFPVLQSSTDDLEHLIAAAYRERTNSVDVILVPLLLSFPSPGYL